MARKLACRIRVAGTLRAEDALHVGGMGRMDESPDADLVLAEDGQGRVYVPGTSLSGVLRSWMRRAGNRAGRPDLEREMWGHLGSNGGKSDDGSASHIALEDAPVDRPPGAAIEIREGVGIDRITGAAADPIKYNRAVLPRGTTFPLVLTLAVPDRLAEDRQAEWKAALARLLQALVDGQIRVGAAGTRGLGRVRLEGLQGAEEKLDSLDGMLGLLRTRDRAAAALPSLSPSELNPLGLLPAFTPRPPLRIDIGWKPAGSLMTKSEGEGIAVDHLPLLTFVPTAGPGDGASAAMSLPWSGVKGVLRAHAERIVRTLTNAAETPRGFLEQLSKVPLVPWVFGAAGYGKEDGKPGQPAASVVEPGRGALSGSDCTTTQRWSPEEWEAVEIANTPEQLREALEGLRLSGASLDPAFHVAIDRWTGGAAEHLLFSVLEPHGFTWEPIRLELDPDRIPEAERGPALALLLVVLRDLACGRLPVGFATHRGMGEVEIDEIALNGEWPTADTEATAVEVRWSRERIEASGFRADSPPNTHWNDLMARIEDEWCAWGDGCASTTPAAYGGAP